MLAVPFYGSVFIMGTVDSITAKMNLICKGNIVNLWRWDEPFKA
jgi:hypothetical protein